EFGRDFQSVKVFADPLRVPNTSSCERPFTIGQSRIVPAGLGVSKEIQGLHRYERATVPSSARRRGFLEAESPRRARPLRATSSASAQPADDCTPVSVQGRASADSSLQRRLHSRPVPINSACARPPL